MTNLRPYYCDPSSKRKMSANIENERNPLRSLMYQNIDDVYAYATYCNITVIMNRETGHINASSMAVPFPTVRARDWWGNTRIKEMIEIFKNKIEGKSERFLARRLFNHVL